MPASEPEQADLAESLQGAAPRLRAFLQRLGGASADVDDVLQEALARAWRYRAAFDPARGDLMSWLLKTAFRCYLDAAARRRREPAASRERALDAEAAPAACGAEGRDRLAVLLRGLGAIEREVLLRFHRQGESLVEIGAGLGLPVGTVKSHLHRARAKLRSLDARLHGEES